MRRRYTDADYELMEKIGENLKRVLKLKGLTQKQLSEMTGLSTSAVSDYVKGKSLMNPGTVQMIADALKVFNGDIDPTFRGTLTEEKKALLLEGQNFNPFKIFDLVDQYTDDEIIAHFHHEDNDGGLSEEVIRKHLSYVRFLKAQE